MTSHYLVKSSLVLLITSSLFFSCKKDDDQPEPTSQNNTVEAPATYVFERNGATSVAFNGQTTRIKMATELVSAMKDFSSSEELLLEMYRNATAAGGDANPFADADLNSTSSSVRQKVAASRDYFSTNTIEGNSIKDQFEGWISAQVSEIYPNEKIAAAPGVAGQIADGSSTRYVNGLGLEYDQLVNKGLIGALMVDQMLNNYLSTAVLDDDADDKGSSREKNDQGIIETDKNYTFMEHKWDEVYGYAFGTATDLTNPVPTIGDDDAFLNKYIGRVEGDDDFTGITQEIYDALKLGRAAIVAKNYTVRDEQVKILRDRISKVIAIRAVYYLQQGKLAIEANNMGTAFHDLSEGYGFLYSLRFTKRTEGGDTYFTRGEVDDLISKLLGDGANGLWNVFPSTLDELSTTIADKFDFTVEQAGS